MKKSMVITLAVIGGLVLSAVVLCGALLIGRANWGRTGFSYTGMMGGNYTQRGFTMMSNGYGMMNGYRASGAATGKPITVDQAKPAVESYLRILNNPDLVLTEIMIFDNNAYARITEKSTGIGAMELLVDPTNLSVFPELGPNMMWSLKYGHMSASGGMMGGRGSMMGNNYNNATNLSTTMTVTSDKALQIAQQYLDQQFPGYKAAANADPFYGYYTIDILKDGNPTGMLSVNGYSGQVFLHTWHGTFIEMWE